MSRITTIAELEAIYGEPGESSLIKEVDYLPAIYQRLIELSPMMMLATVGPEGLDCSPRGDQPGFVRVVDERTLMFPDRRGNNRVDSLRNIVRDERVALLFLIPGSGTTFRVNGRASLTTDAECLASFAVEGKEPRCVVEVHVEAAYFQCARAIVRSQLWDAATYPETASVPTAGKILAAISDNQHGGETYDKEWPEQAKKTLW